MRASAALKKRVRITNHRIAPEEDNVIRTRMVFRVHAIIRLLHPTRSGASVGVAAVTDDNGTIRPVITAKMSGCYVRQRQGNILLDSEAQNKLNPSRNSKERTIIWPRRIHNYQESRWRRRGDGN